MGLADARRPQQDNIFRTGSKGQSGQLVNLSFVNGRLNAEVEFLQAFSIWKTGELRPHFLTLPAAFLLLGG